jgi:hypothetical protein
MLSVDRNEIYSLCAQGELQSVKLGRRRFVFRDSVLEYVERLKELGERQREQQEWAGEVRTKAVYFDGKTASGGQA